MARAKKDVKDVKGAKGAKKVKTNGNGHGSVEFKPRKGITSDAERRADTGTRFRVGSKRQQAYDIIAKACVKTAMPVQDLRALVAQADGLDGAYVGRAVCEHMDDFEIKGGQIRYTGSANVEKARKTGDAKPKAKAKAKSEPKAKAKVKKVGKAKRAKKVSAPVVEMVAS